MWYGIMYSAFLITLFSFGTLFVEASVTVADRLQVTLSMVATLASYTFVLQQAVPKTSYNTLLDYYLLSSLATLSLVVVQNVALGWKSGEHLDEAGEEHERTSWSAEHDMIQLWSRIFFVAVWLAWQGCVAWMMCREHYRAERFVEFESPEAVANSQKNAERHRTQPDRRGRLRKESTQTLVRKQSTGELLERDERRDSTHERSLL